VSVYTRLLDECVCLCDFACAREFVSVCACMCVCVNVWVCQCVCVSVSE